jgi:recombinational DNA repair protein (RecF pathway)
MIKKLIIVVALTVFGVAAQAGDCCGGCCGSQAATVKTSTASGGCCMKAKAEQAKAAQGNKAKATAKKVLQSPKAISLACR